MSKTPIYGFHLTPADENTTFFEWRQKMNGSGVESNMELIESAIAAIDSAVDQRVEDATDEILNTAGQMIDKSAADTLLMVDDKIDKSSVSTLNSADQMITDAISVVTEKVDKKVDAEDGKGLSCNDYTDDEKTKLGNIEDGANRFEFPVGYIYISTGGTNPAELFGGTWEQIEGRFLLGANSSYPAGSMDGAATHKLTSDELPYTSLGSMLTDFTMGYTTASPSSSGSTTQRFLADVSPVTRSLSFGGNSAHNNMPPYLAVYIWKRVL